MEPRKPKCAAHHKSIKMICLKCERLMCYKCTGPHVKDGCSGGVVDLPSYAEEALKKQLCEMLTKLEADKQKVDDSARGFMGALPEIVEKLRKIKGNAEKLVANIEKSLVALEGYGPESAGIAYIAMKEALEQYLENLPSAAKSGNMGQIMKAITAAQTSMGQGELQLRDDTIASVNKVLLEETEFETLIGCMQGLVATCKDVFKRKFGVAVTSRFVYGICGPMGGYAKLCRYDIVTKKITPCVAVPQYCTVLQIGKQIFISGGCNPVVNTLQEFLGETQSLVSKVQMTYARYYHTSIAISETQFMIIGGYSSSSLAYCEEYYIRDNTWKLIPSLNQARHGAAATLSGDGAYLYVIGGAGSNNVIERMDIKEKKVWDKVALSGAADVSLGGYLAAFPTSTDEIMIFVSSGTTDCGIYNTKAGTVKKLSQTVKSDNYYCNQVSMINGDAYIMGISYGHMHIYRTDEKRIEEIDYSAATSA